MQTSLVTRKCPDYKGVHVSMGKFSSVERHESLLGQLEVSIEEPTMQGIPLFFT